MVYNFRTLLTLRRGRSCAGHKKCSTYFFKRSWDIILGPAQDRPLRSADLAGSDYQLKELELYGVFKPAKLHVFHLQ